eukprot:366519-Chlamydomonas_euryale.AAC.9
MTPLDATAALGNSCPAQMLFHAAAAFSPSLAGFPCSPKYATNVWLRGGVAAGPLMGDGSAVGGTSALSGSGGVPGPAGSMVTAGAPSSPPSSGTLCGLSAHQDLRKAGTLLWTLVEAPAHQPWRRAQRRAGWHERVRQWKRRRRGAGASLRCVQSIHFSTLQPV